MVSTGRVDVEPLRRRVDGQVVLPGEDGYDSARALWNAMVDRWPAVVVRCASSADVATAIDFSRSNDLEIGVRCGGHSVLGISVPVDGLLMICRDCVRSGWILMPAEPGCRVERCWGTWTGQRNSSAWRRR